MPTGDNIGLDTTIVLRLLTGEPERQFEKAKKFIEEQLSNHKKLLISDLVMTESYFALYYHYKVPKAEVIQQLDNLLSSGMISQSPGSVCQKVIKDHKNHHAGFVDQIIYEQYCLFADTVVSFDQSMGKLDRAVLL